MQYPQILDECITNLEDGDWTISTCLAQYPIYAEQLRDDLAIFHLSKQIAAPSLSDATVDAMEAKLLRQFNRVPSQSTKPVKPNPRRRQWYTQPMMRWAAGFVFMLMLLIGTGGGTVVMASSSLPGDGLYPVKTTWEQVVITGATIVNQQDGVWLNLAQVRADEIIQLQEAGRTIQITDEVLDTFYNTASSAILYSTPATTEEYIAFTESIRPIFTENVLPDVSEATRFRILSVLNPEVDSLGKLVIANSDSFLPQAEITETPEPTLEPTATYTMTPTQTATATMTSTMTSTPTLTRTPTPSRTPSPVPSVVITATYTLTPTPTSTLTPLPVGTRGSGSTTQSDTGEQVFGPGIEGDFSSGENIYFIRETEKAVELTQTAIAGQ